MLKINSDKEIEINRGDRGTIKLIANTGKFEEGKKIKFSVVEKGNYNNVILQKEYTITEESQYAYITLTSEDTRIGDIISKKQEYWYEIEYDGDLTLVGYDDDKQKKFILYPEAPEKGGNE